MATEKFNKSMDFDKANSTWRQEIYLTNGRVFTGYSKKKAFTEKNNKTHVLINMIIRMFECGYLDQNSSAKDAIECIEFYDQRTQPQKRVCTLYYTFKKMEPEYIQDTELCNFLDKFYELVRAGKTGAQINSALYRRQRTSAEDPFDCSSQKFTKEIDLEMYCAHLKNKSKFPPEQVDHFYRKYYKKYFDKGGVLDSQSMETFRNKLNEKFKGKSIFHSITQYDYGNSSIRSSTNYASTGCSPVCRWHKPKMAQNYEDG